MPHQRYRCAPHPRAGPLGPPAWSRNVLSNHRNSTRQCTDSKAVIRACGPVLRRVQELAKGRSLAQLVCDGWRGSEDEIKQLAAQLLDILQYLAGRRPPVTHRWSCFETNSFR